MLNSIESAAGHEPGLRRATRPRRQRGVVRHALLAALVTGAMAAANSGGAQTAPTPAGAGTAGAVDGAAPVRSAVVAPRSGEGPAAPLRPGEPIWDKLGETPVLTLYLDRTSVQREAAIRRVVEMQDLKVPDPDGVLSRRYINEYDCENQMHRIGQMTSWSGSQLSGRKLFDVAEWGYWRKIPANGLFTLGFRQLCPPRAGESLTP